VPYGERYERTQDCTASVLLQAEGNCKQPAHGGVEAVKRA
jgi:hypothetical protein